MRKLASFLLIILLLSAGCTPSDPVLAEWADHEILQSYVENYKTTLGASGVTEFPSDYEITVELVENTILLDEAERLGLTATEEEIESMIQSSEEAYELPAGKEFLDSYCAAVGITVEEYFTLLREQLPKTIARQKLKDHIGRTYCEENGLEFTKMNPPQAMLDAVDQYIAELVEQAGVTYQINED